MVLSLDRWIGKVAVVTGASSGIGAAITEYLVAKEINVVGLARRTDLMEEKSKQLSDKKGKLYVVKADMSVEEDIIKAFKWIEENLGQVNILINNAGIWEDTSLWNGDVKAWKNILDVNILGLCIATKETVRRMVYNKINGHIININSICGHQTISAPNLNLYSPSKFAVTALTKILRQELIEIDAKIKTTSLSPGLVDTEMTTQCEYSAGRREFCGRFPLLEPEAIAEAVGYILSTPENVQINELTITPLGEKL